MRNVRRKQKRQQFWKKLLNAVESFSQREFILVVMVFIIGFLTAYSASAAKNEPSKADWEAYAQLKPVKKFDYEKVYNDIDKDLARLSMKEDKFAQNLPVQLTGPMHAISKKSYRNKVAKNQ